MDVAKLLALLLALIASFQAPQPSQRVLDIAWHHQEHNLTCEAAALKMALSYHGVSVDELILIRYMTNDRRAAGFDAAGRLSAWGDPMQGFVGNPDGRIERYEGYGVYYRPVAIATVLSGIHVIEAGTGIAPDAVYNAVLEGHPVVAWISNKYHQVGLLHYTAFDGSDVGYTLTEHAVTVIGVRPDAVLINDPWFGQAWHAKAQFESAYLTFDHMAVIVGA